MVLIQHPPPFSWSLIALHCWSLLPWHSCTIFYLPWCDINFFLIFSEAEKRKVLALVLLPLLFSAPGNVNRNKRGIVPWKPSKQDCVNGFIFRSPDSCSYEDRLLEKKNFLATRKIAFQPITVAVGTLDNFSQSLVVIDDIKYSFKSVLEAFVFCFKSYFALNAQYPVECGSSYSFIQQHVFKIDIKSNSKSYRAVNDLINSLNCISASDSSSS